MIIRQRAVCEKKEKTRRRSQNCRSSDFNVAKFYAMHNKYLQICDGQNIILRIWSGMRSRFRWSPMKLWWTHATSSLASTNKTAMLPLLFTCTHQIDTFLRLKDFHRLFFIVIIVVVVVVVVVLSFSAQLTDTAHIVLYINCWIANKSHRIKWVERRTERSRLKNARKTTRHCMQSNKKEQLFEAGWTQPIVYECALVQTFDLHDKILFEALIWSNWVEIIGRRSRIMICWARSTIGACFNKISFAQHFMKNIYLFIQLFNGFMIFSR